MHNGNGKVLIIDDSQIVLEVARKTLEDAGYEVVTRDQPIGSGAAILRERPDLVLLDLEMPALDGGQLLKMIRGNEHLRDTVVLLFSSTDPAALKQRAQGLGADGCVCKGEDLGALVAAVQAKLSRARQPVCDAALR